MSRRLVWVQLLIGWLPVWALLTTLIAVAHPTSVTHAGVISLRMVVAAAVLGLVVQRLTERFPWPRQVRVRFVALNALAAAAYAIAWLLLNSVIESVVRGSLVIVVGYSLASFVMLGVWLYVMVAGVSYTMQATERAGRAEANAARAHLATLRSQLNPHFLFNALHTVVQLIPREPQRASQAAEQLAGLLRTTLEEDRDLVSVAEELAFVDRYLDVERIRFGDRLQVRMTVSARAREALIPSFSVQTLVENAVRHGATPRVEPTEVSVRGDWVNGTLTVTVADSGSGATAEQIRSSAGTGIKRLRERLSALYAGAARLDVGPGATGGVTATLVVPQDAG